MSNLSLIKIDGFERDERLPLSLSSLVIQHSDSPSDYRGASTSHALCDLFQRMVRPDILRRILDDCARALGVTHKLVVDVRPVGNWSVGLYWPGAYC